MRSRKLGRTEDENNTCLRIHFLPDCFLRHPSPRGNSVDGISGKICQAHHWMVTPNRSWPGRIWAHQRRRRRQTLYPVCQAKNLKMLVQVGSESSAYFQRKRAAGLFKTQHRVVDSLPPSWRAIPSTSRAGNRHLAIKLLLGSFNRFFSRTYIHDVVSSLIAVA